MVNFLTRFINNLFNTQPTSSNNIFINNKKNQPISSISSISSILPILPIEIMQKIFKYSDKKSLFSCIFVNKYWYNCIVPILWENPFKLEPIEYPYLKYFPPVLRNFTHNKNRFMIIEIYLSCLNEDDELYIHKRKPLLNYPIYLKQLDYDDLENLVSLYLANFPDKDNKEREVQSVTKTLFKLILQKSRNLRILTIQNRRNMKHEFPNLKDFSNQQPGLFNLIKIKIEINDDHISILNIKYLLKLISLNCNQIHYLDINLKKLNDDNDSYIEIINYISDIIKSQNYLMEFSISFVKLYFDQIMFALLFQKSSLISIRLYNIIFNENSNNLLKEFNHIKDLSLIHCDGVDNNNLEIKSIFNDR
ncbi:hypothetical protein C1645_811375 [Glomus cerebriforme]|uniref:F-box domain-containing protein n=1 Tax=Glomus cerebriforme TaxID=658196 RepID=A0A397TQ62_9GLOM|nr:hypothetical protein C1645_811375 [Glomus cerebriforme]